MSSINFQCISNHDYDLGMIDLRKEYEESDFLNEFEDRIKDCYLDELKNITHTKRRIEYLAVRCLLKKILKKDLLVYYREDGKPYLKDESVDISISHCKTYVVVVCSRMRHVGVDIEECRENLLRVKHKYLSPQEQNDIETNSYDSVAYKKYLLLYWCAKEAVFKVSEKPVPEFSEEIRIYPFGLKDKIMFAHVRQSDYQDDFVLVYEWIADDCAIVVAKKRYFRNELNS